MLHTLQPFIPSTLNPMPRCAPPCTSPIRIPNPYSLNRNPKPSTPTPPPHPARRTPTPQFPNRVVTAEGSAEVTYLGDSPYPIMRALQGGPVLVAFDGSAFDFQL